MIYVNKGDCHVSLNKYNDAILDYNDAIKYNPNNEELYLNRAKIYFKLNSRDLAIEDVKRAAKLGHKDSQNDLKKAGIDW